MAGPCEHGDGTVLVGNCAVWLVGLRPTHTISLKPWKCSGSAVNTFAASYLNTQGHQNAGHLKGPQPLLS